MQVKRVAALLTGAALLLSACSQGPSVGGSATAPTDSSTAQPAQTQAAEPKPCTDEAKSALPEWAEAINAHGDMKVVRFLDDFGGCCSWLLEVYWQPRKSGVFLTEGTAHQAVARIVSHLPPNPRPEIMIVLSADRVFPGWCGPVYIVQGALDELQRLAREGRKAFPEDYRILWTYFDRARQ